MADYASYEWAHTPRWRRWVARFAALVALVACGAGVYVIAREATRPGPPPPVSLQPQIEQVAASTEVLAVRLEALGPRSSTARALVAVREAQGDRRAASQVLREQRAGGPVRDAGVLANALGAHKDYLAVVAALLRNPRSRIGDELAARARRAKAAWAALPDPAGLPHAIRGSKHLVAVAHARRG